MLKEQKRREEKSTDPLIYVRSLLGEEQHIQKKNLVSSDSTYIHYENNGDTFLMAFQYSINN